MNLPDLWRHLQSQLFPPELSPHLLLAAAQFNVVEAARTGEGRASALLLHSVPVNKPASNDRLFAPIWRHKGVALRDPSNGPRSKTFEMWNPRTRRWEEHPLGCPIPPQSWR